ncbi:hypothetical protein QJS66_04965 [Kocuria rhizophila]|nr:hypothetical protein QJS66_04965 [Kocuria rhizophila]
MDIRHRVLRRVRVAERGARRARAFSLLIGSQVAPRKDFVVAGASHLNQERIDTTGRARGTTTGCVSAAGARRRQVASR